METKRIAANVIIRSGEEIVLIKQNEASYDIKIECPWALPGGGVEKEETPEQAVVREAREETGLIIGPLTLVGDFIQRSRDGKGGFVDGTLFLYESLGWAPQSPMLQKPTYEVLEVRLMSYETILKMKDEIGFGYFNMLLQYMRCMDGIDQLPFSRVRLGIGVEYEPWGLRGKDPLVLKI